MQSDWHSPPSGRITTLRTPRLRICNGMKVESFTAPPSMRCCTAASPDWRIRIISSSPPSASSGPILPGRSSSIRSTQPASRQRISSPSSTINTRSISSCARCHCSAGNSEGHTAASWRVGITTRAGRDRWRCRAPGLRPPARVPGNVTPSKSVPPPSLRWPRRVSCRSWRRQPHSAAAP